MAEGELEQRYFESLRDAVIKEVWREAGKQMRSCSLCPLKCGTDRLSGNRGACGASLTGEVFYAGLLVNEEHDLNPAYEVFFTGCNLGCRFCYLADKVKSSIALRDNHSGPLPLYAHPLYNDRDLVFAEIPFVMSSYYNQGGVEYEDVYAGAEQCFFGGC